MAYNRWLSSNYLEHHGVKGQQWGVTNGPPYPLDSSKSDGHKLIKGDGSPQGKKKYTASQKTAHKRAVKRERSGDTDTESAKKKLLKLSDADREKYRSAVQEDKYELSFLEAIQNEDWEDNNDKKRRDKEYLEYLRDREGYFQKGNVELARTIFDNRFAKGDREKFISDNYRPFYDEENREYVTEKTGQRKDFGQFLESVPRSKKFKELVQRFTEAEAEARRLNEVALTDGKTTSLKEYTKSLAELSKIRDQLGDEGCRILGVNPNKVHDMYKAHLGEDLMEIELHGKASPPLTRSDINTKKSVKDIVSAFRDRLFGNNSKASDTSIGKDFEPESSEKAKTKRGESYEINDWGSGKDSINTFKKSPESHIKTARKAAIGEARRMLGWYAKKNPEVKRLLNMSDEQLGRRIGLNTVTGYSLGTVEFSFGDIDGDFLGHEVIVEYDLNKKRVINTRVEG